METGTALREHVRILSCSYTILERHDNYVQNFKTALYRMPTGDCRLIIQAVTSPFEDHERCFNTPVLN